MLQLLLTTLALARETLETGASRIASLPSMILCPCIRSISMGNSSLLDLIVATLESGLKHAWSTTLWPFWKSNKSPSCTECFMPATPNTTLLAILSKGDGQTGLFYINSYTEIAEGQHIPLFITTTQVVCRDGATFEDPCSLPDDYTWHKWSIDSYLEVNIRVNQLGNTSF